MATWQKTLASGNSWIIPFDPTRQDFQATIVISKDVASGATEDTSVDIEFTLSEYAEIAAGTAVWVDFLLQDVADEFATASTIALATNIGKPVTALRATALQGTVTVQAIQAGI
jgi:hypothetical protein